MRNVAIRPAAAVRLRRSKSSVPSNREQRLSSLRNQKPDGASRLTGINERVDVRVFGDWAIVLVTSSWLADGKRVGDPYQATHVWAKRDGRWRLVAAQISAVHP